MSEEKAVVKKPKRFRWKSTILVLIVWVIALWFWHPFLFSFGLKKGLEIAMQSNGLRLVHAEIHVRLFQPIVIYGLEIKTESSQASTTSLRIEKVSMTLQSIRQMWEGRFIREVVMDHTEGILDFRSQESPQSPLKEGSISEQQQVSDRILSFLPEAITIKNGNLEILADEQAYTIRNLNIRFNEDAVEEATLSKFSASVGSIYRHFEDLHAITAWQHGTLYVGGVKLSPEVELHQFTADLIRLGGPGLTFELQAFGGTLRGNIGMDVKENRQDIEAALVIRMFPVKAFPELLAMDMKTDGLIREARWTFHGDPSAWMDAEMSLRLYAENVQWMDKGWDLLTGGMVYVDRKLTLSELLLKQGTNTAKVSGELKLPLSDVRLANADYTINLSSDIPNLSKLVTLFGDWPIAGKMSLNGNIKGRGLDFDGALKLEAQDANYAGIPIKSAKSDIRFKNGEADIVELEVLSKKDHVRGKGTVQLTSPYAFNGELDVSLTDISNYLSSFPNHPLPQIQAGSLDLQWQGDGIPSANSGAFTLKLNHVVTPWTPAGLSAITEGTYSPENIDLRKIEIDRDSLHLSAQSTLAASGISVRGIRLSTQKKALLQGDIFVPVNAFSLWPESKRKAALDANGTLFAKVTSGELDLQELGGLFGQKLPFEGRFSLQVDASGTARSPKLTATLNGKSLRALEVDTKIPPAMLGLQLSIVEGVAQLGGKVITPGFDPMTIQAKVSLSQPGDGILGWINPDAPIEAIAKFPRTELKIFQPFLPKMRRIQGILSGDIRLTNTLSDPKIQGILELHQGAIEMDLQTPPITDLEARLKFDTETAQVEKFTGAIGAGPFSIKGSLPLNGAGWDLNIQGKKVLLARNPNLRLRANVDLQVKGSKEASRIAGSVRLVDGRIFQRLEILPLIIPNAVQQNNTDALPRLEGLVPKPFSAWTLDVRIFNETPFLLGGNIVQGQIIPMLTLGGTAGNPIPTGTITLKDIQAFLPFSIMTISEGFIHFSAENPMMPLLDIRGTVQTQNYDVIAYAYGPLNERRFILRSDPPLTQESIVLLLTTGIIPSGTLAGQGFGQVAIGQGTMLILRALSRQFDLRGAHMDSLLNRLQISTTPGNSPREGAGLRSDFRIGKGFSATLERDGINFYNLGVTYNFRFR